MEIENSVKRIIVLSPNLKRDCLAALELEEECSYEIVIKKQVIISTVKNKALDIHTLRDKYLILYMIIMCICIISAITAIAYFDNTLENYQYYQQLLNTAISGVLGLIIIITMFYLGKFHDYNKDFFQIHSKIGISLRSHSKRTALLKSLCGIAKQQTIADRQFIEKIELAENNISDIENIEKLKNKYENTAAATDYVFIRSKPMRVCIFLLVGPVVIWTVGNLLSGQTDGILYYQSSMLASMVTGMLIFWKQCEQHMGARHYLYNELVIMSTVFQTHRDDVEESILDLKEITTRDECMHN